MKLRELYLFAALFPAFAMAGNAASADFPKQPEPEAPTDLWPHHAVPDDEVAREGRKALPFTRKQIELLARLLQQTQEATARAGAGIRPEGRIRRVPLPQAGDRAVPVIHVRRGYTTVLSFTDVTGSTWPIEEVLVDRAFLSESPAEKPGEAAAPPGNNRSGHLLYLVPQRSWLAGNAVVKLKRLADPLVLVLKDEGGSVVDFRVDLRLDLPGPNVDAAALARADGLQAGDPRLLGLLTGVVPPQAIRLALRGGGINDRAWRLGSDLLLVTRYDLLSPGPWAAERGAGGRWAYRLPDTPFALVSADGQVRRLAFRTSETSRPETDNER